MKADPTGPSPDDLVALLLTRLAALFLDAWLVMVTLGVVHGERAVIPTLGYWQCVLGLAVLGFVLRRSAMMTEKRVQKVGELIIAERKKPAAPDAWRGIKGDQWS